MYAATATRCASGRVWVSFVGNLHALFLFLAFLSFLSNLVNSFDLLQPSTTAATTSDFLLPPVYNVRKGDCRIVRWMYGRWLVSVRKARRKSKVGREGAGKGKNFWAAS